MKKEFGFALIFIIIFFGVWFYYMDKKNVESGKEPEYCIKIVKEEEKKVNYYCLGYTATRKYGNKPNESFDSMDFGVWFFKKEIKN